MLGSSFTYNNIHLKKEAAMSIVKTNSKIYVPKSYNKNIANPIYSTR